MDIIAPSLVLSDTSACRMPRPEFPRLVKLVRDLSSNAMRMPPADAVWPKGSPASEILDLQIQETRHHQVLASNLP